MDNIPYIAFEAELARYERMARRLFRILIFTIALLFASNMAWLWVFNSYDFSTEQVELDGSTGGNANYIGASGVINNGKSHSEEADGPEEGSEQTEEDIDEAHGED